MSARRVIVMGPSGSGKTAVGAALAVDLAVEFVDADDLHPAANVAKMAAGDPLDDADRIPWLDIVGRTLADLPGGGDQGRRHRRIESPSRSCRRRTG